MLTLYEFLSAHIVEVNDILFIPQVGAGRKSELQVVLHFVYTAQCNTVFWLGLPVYFCSFKAAAFNFLDCAMASEIIVFEVGPIMIQHPVIQNWIIARAGRCIQPDGIIVPVPEHQSFRLFCGLVEEAEILAAMAFTEAIKNLYL